MFVNIRGTKEKLLIDSGHTLSIIQYKDMLYAYRGSVGFNKVDMFIGTDMDNLVFHKELTNMKGKRWPVAFKLGEYISILCTATDGMADIFEHQHIHHYTSIDGKNFNHECVIVDGSAPWLYMEDDVTFFFYHKKRDKHRIYIRQGLDGNEYVVMETPNRDVVVSAPAVFKYKSMYYMLIETREDATKPWVTDMLESKDVKGPYKNRRTVLDNWRACAFPHIIDDRLIITYSHKKKCGIWDLRYKEILI